MFHLREGFFYERMPEGQIHIVHAMTVEGLPKVVGDITVPDNEWASVMASTSYRGETRETWIEALKYLSGNEG